MRSIHKNYEDILKNRVIMGVLFILVVLIEIAILMHGKAERAECKEMTLLAMEQKLYRHLLHGDYNLSMEELGYGDL